MFGSSELLVVAAIVLGIIFIPRIIGPKSSRRKARPRFRLSGRMRLSLVLSVLYLGAAAAYFNPWQSDPLLFLYAGTGPVVLAWLIYWVVAGFRKL